LVEEVGLLNLPNLLELKLEMNRGWLLTEICNFFYQARSLRIINLANNALSNKQSAQVISSLQLKVVQYLDLSHNHMGPSSV
jgi:hypothetical protein